MKSLTYLAFASAIGLLFTIATAKGAESVRVSESCDKYSCTIKISGPDVPCVRSARLKSWEAGYMAAVAIRDCMDKAAMRLAAK